MKRVKEYELYTHGFGEISNQYPSRGAKPWVIRVRAKSIKQAYWLLGNEEVGSETKLGIVFVDHSNGPNMLDDWPFSFDVEEVDCPWNKESGS